MLNHTGGPFMRLFCSCVTIVFFALSALFDCSIALEYENCSGSTNLEYEWGAGGVVRNAGSIDYDKDGYQDLFLSWTSGSNNGLARVWKGIPVPVTTADTQPSSYWRETLHLLTM